jgi:hypothetical protein
MTRGSEIHTELSRHFDRCERCMGVDPEAERVTQGSISAATFAALCVDGRTIYHAHLRWLAEPDFDAPSAMPSSTPPSTPSGTPSDTRAFVLDLTKDELTILRYVIPCDSWGDPLKDTYELGSNEPENPYAVLKELHAKVMKLRWGWGK